MKMLLILMFAKKKELNVPPFQEIVVIEVIEVIGVKEVKGQREANHVPGPLVAVVLVAAAEFSGFL
jgi:hypothetical protein